MCAATMSGTCGHPEEHRPHWCPWKRGTRRVSYEMFCCSCLQGEKKGDRQELQAGAGLVHVPLDRHEEREKEIIQIMVEDLGIVNPSFSLFEEDYPAQRNISASEKVLKEERGKHLTSLPIQPHAKYTEDEEGEEEDSLLFDSCPDSMLASENLMTPAINLIPPSPSDVIHEDQFFDINSDESVLRSSGSNGRFICNKESIGENMESVDSVKSKEAFHLLENKFGADGAAELFESRLDQFAEEMKVFTINKEVKASYSAYCRAPPTEHRQKRSFNPGINLLSFTEHNLDDMSNKDVSCPDMLLLPHAARMNIFTHKQRPVARSCSFGDSVSRSLSHTEKQQKEEESTRQQRITIASYMPECEDQNGNVPEKDIDGQVAKSLRELNTDEVCQWFTSIGLHKCLPFIKDANLCGADIAAVDVNTLDILRIVTLADREQLLSAIYNELHPPNTTTQQLHTLLGPNKVDTLASTFMPMSKSKSSPHVSCLSMNRQSLKLRHNSQNDTVQRSSPLIEIAINASQQIVHLRTPKETTLEKIIDSCMKMLGMTEEKDLFTLKANQGSVEALSPDQQVGSLLTSSIEKRQLELQLCKMEKPKTNNAFNENESANVQGNQPAKEERIRELNQQVDSLQNVILQVQELHHDLVEFCTQLKNMDAEVDVEGRGSADLKQRFDVVKSRLKDKRQNLYTLRGTSNSMAHEIKPLEVRLLEKMKLNCQVFKEEISIVHLNRQMAHLQNALQENYDKERALKKGLAIVSLSQLVTPRCPAIMMVVQESVRPDGHYGFTCHYREGSGLVVVRVHQSHLCVDDRLVEVNGVPVISSTEEELNDLLIQGPCAQIVVLRQPPPIFTSHGHPLLLPHGFDPDPIQSICPEMDVITKETPP